MAGLFRIQPIEPRASQGVRESFGTGFEAGASAAITEGFIGTQASQREALGGWLPVLDQIETMRGQVPGEVVNAARSVRQRRGDIDFDALSSLTEWVSTDGARFGLGVADDMLPEIVSARQSEILARDIARAERDRETMARSPYGAALMGQMLVEMGDPVNVATLPVGASARVGLLGTILIEGTINAGIEAAQTPTRNARLEQLGLETTTALENAAFGFLLGGAFGGIIKGAELTLPGLERIGRLLRGDRETLVQAAREVGTDETRAVATQVQRDIEEIAENAPGGDPAAEREHEARTMEAARAVEEGTAPDMPDRPVIARPSSAIVNGEIEEVDPRDLLVQPDVFQFRSNVVAEGGQTERLLDVAEWHSERAGIIVVYEYADGSRAVADGHQRTGLARRIMDQTGERITMAARVFREIDGFTPTDIRVLAALKNIAEASDGMSAAMARDAARVLRVDPEAAAQMPAGPGMARARALSSLSDEAFDMFINEVVPERFAELVGRMVNDLSLHGAMMTLLQRTNPQTTTQAESILAQALQAPVSRETTADLFGEQEITRSLYVERAKVLERAMRIMRDERSLFRTLDDRADQIEGVGANRLDAQTNRDIRVQTEQAVAAVQRLAHRAGPISEALNDAARTYQEKGRLKDAARTVVDAVRREIERIGLDGLASGPAGRNAEPDNARAAAPDRNQAYSDPVAGEGVRAQIDGTFDALDPVPPDSPNADLFDAVPVDIAEDDVGQRSAVIRTRDEIAADLDADDDAVAVLDACVKG
jgi:hypothetical protein